MGFDRRRFPRVPEAFRIQYRVAGDVSSWFSVSTVDLSACGVRFTHAEPLEPGVTLRFKITLPGFKEPLELRGLVVWCRTAFGDAMESGIEFMDVTMKQQIVIDRMVGFLSRRAT